MRKFIWLLSGIAMGCGSTDSALRAQSGPVVVCRDLGQVVLTAVPDGAAMRTTYPWHCPSGRPPSGVWAQAVVVPPLPASRPAEVVAFRAVDGTWYLVDERACTDVPAVPPFHEVACPPGGCVRGDPAPC